MDVEVSATSNRGRSSLVTIHGFRVQSYGQPVSPGFKKALRRLEERAFDDTSCVVVKTQNGSRSGITHAGGRYVHPTGDYSTEVMRQMRALGMEPPSPPFLITPGKSTLYHEWGHHVDRTWSGDDQDVGFSFRWFSRFYQLGMRASRGVSMGDLDWRPIGSGADAGNAVLVWRLASSELFASLFDDWMRGDKMVGWDECEPKSLNRHVPPGHPPVKFALLPETGVAEVCAETYHLFTSGIRRSIDLPPVRPGLFGDYTDEIVSRLPTVIETLRTLQR